MEMQTNHLGLRVFFFFLFLLNKKDIKLTAGRGTGISQPPRWGWRGPWPLTASWRKPGSSAALTPLQTEAFLSCPCPGGLGALLWVCGVQAAVLAPAHPPQGGWGSLPGGVRLRKVTFANEVL